MQASASSEEPFDNLLTELIEFDCDVMRAREDPNITKEDIVEMVHTRVSSLVKKTLYTPLKSFFSFNLNPVKNQDTEFDRLALRLMELRS